MAHEPEFDADKFRELLLYVAQRSVGDPAFGKVKLARILCYSDFLTYAYLGQPIAGATYLRYSSGPMPKQLEGAQAEVERRGDALLFEAPYLARPRQRLLALREPNRARFTPAELAIVDQVIEDLKRDAVSCELSGWRTTRELAEIPYDTVFLSDEPPSDADTQWALEIAREHGLLSAE